MFYTYYKKFGNTVYLRYKEEGKTVNGSIADCKANLYVPVTDGDDSDGQTIYGQNVREVEFETFRHAKEFAEQHKHTDNYPISGNANFDQQLIIETLNGEEVVYDPLSIRCCYHDIEVDTGDSTEFPSPSQTKFPINAITMFDNVDNIFYIYSLKNNEDDIWVKSESILDVVKTGEISIQYNNFESEKFLLEKFLTDFKSINFDLISGWNSELFDIPYVINRCYKLFGKTFVAECLSPFGKIYSRDGYDRFGKPVVKFTILGMPHLDYMKVYEKFNFTPRSSFKLGAIAQDEDIGVGKLSYEEERSLSSLYRNNFQKFIDYNIQDVNIIRLLDAKLGFMSIAYSIAYLTLGNFEDSLGTVKMWENLIAKRLWNDGIVPPYKYSSAREDEEYEGGFVKDPVVGHHINLVSSDLNSLYPHIEQQWNIGPETRIEPYKIFDVLMKKKAPVDILNYAEDQFETDLQKLTMSDFINENIPEKLLATLKAANVTIAANRQLYTLDKMSFFSSIKRTIYSDRKVNKRKMLDAEKEKVKHAKNSPEYKKFELQEIIYYNIQQALKIVLNGGYGAVANTSFLYYMVENAEAITLCGQLVNMNTASKMDAELNEIFGTKDFKYWCYGDTDSAYYTLPNIGEFFGETDPEKTTDLIDMFYKEVMDVRINAFCDRMAFYLNCYEQRMIWEREVIARAGIFVGKKTYALMVDDSEGTRYPYNDPYIKIVGLEAKKSTLPEWSKKELKTCYTFCLHQDKEGMYSHIDKVYNKVMNTMEITELGKPIKVGDLEKWSNDEFHTEYIKGTPHHIKAAIVFNRILKDTPVKGVYPIGNGTPVLLLPLKLKKNPWNESKIAYEGYLPKELGLEKYIDKEKAYNDTFVKPLEVLLGGMNWTFDEIITL